ncbi:uncharacterized protein GLRG_04081 [Colletotrichum graminicola M1.001]|uniref:Uncharacterized protein n=1 Tax=Colletotrichum graminicola (strain M1.001 / M2 / FGSC 10212) TaxID=645133 RepID=E3QDG5_COLGM|nr:uncharacterized protein GLRG_04081 [Colletotrichum graminicola M1.001]EFQ28937.1 hypothetical protein GLRG_04081 [Colletotrichum graminicola M1.001]
MVHILPHPAPDRPETIRQPEEAQLTPMPMDLTCDFFATFKSTSPHRLPFCTPLELVALFDGLVGHNPSPVATQPQVKATTFSTVLAVGTLATRHTDMAATLYFRAMRVAVILEKTIALQMIWVATVMADNQINLGRPSCVPAHRDYVSKDFPWDYTRSPERLTWARLCCKITAQPFGFSTVTRRESAT